MVKRRIVSRSIIDSQSMLVLSVSRARSRSIRSRSGRFHHSPNHSRVVDDTMLFFARSFDYEHHFVESEREFDWS